MTDVFDQSPDVVSTSSNSAPSGSSSNYAEIDDIISTTLPGDTYNDLDADRREHPVTGFYRSLKIESRSNEANKSFDYYNATLATVPTSTATGLYRNLKIESGSKEANKSLDYCNATFATAQRSTATATPEAPDAVVTMATATIANI